MNAADKLLHIVRTSKDNTRILDVWRRLAPGAKHRVIFEIWRKNKECFGNTDDID